MFGVLGSHWPNSSWLMTFVLAFQMLQLKSFICFRDVQGLDNHLSHQLAWMYNYSSGVCEDSSCLLSNSCRSNGRSQSSCKKSLCCLSRNQNADTLLFKAADDKYAYSAGQKVINTNQRLEKKTVLQTSRSKKRCFMYNISILQ